MNAVKHYYFTFSPTDADKMKDYPLSSTWAVFSLSDVIKFLLENKDSYSYFAVPENPELYGWDKNYFITIGTYNNVDNTSLYLYHFIRSRPKFRDYSCSATDVCLGQVLLIPEMLNPENKWYIIKVNEQDNLISKFFYSYNTFPTPVKINSTLIDALQFVFTHNAKEYIIGPAENNPHCFEKYYETHPSALLLNQNVTARHTAHTEAFLKVNDDGELRVVIVNPKINHNTHITGDYIKADDYNVEDIAPFVIATNNANLKVNVFREDDIKKYFCKTIDFMSQDYLNGLEKAREKTMKEVREENI